METKPNILIVDDDADLNASIHDVLEMEGYTVGSAANGRDAVAMSQKSIYNIAIVDIKLPDITGTEVVSEIAKVSPSTEFIYMTGHATLDSAIEAARQEHIISYEIKPANIDRLLSIIKQVITRKKAEKKYQDLYDNAPDMFASIDAETASISQCNQTFATTLGYCKEDIIGQEIFFVYHPDCMDAVKKAFQSFVNTGEVHNAELQLKRKDGSKIDVALNVSAVRDENGKILHSRSVWRDITEQKRTEKMLKASLSEKILLVREIYHRTRNNMQVICSLLNMQSRRTKDEQVLTVFKETENRIKSMSLIHSKLYESQDLSNIKFISYIKDLTNNLLRAYHINPDTISLKYSADDIFMTFDTAVPCGLAINEIVTNSLKYAFPDNRKGEIKIDLRSTDEGEIELQISDNGIGMPKNFDPRETKTIGMPIIFNLIEYQLNGKVDLNLENGVEFLLKFKMSDRKERV